MRRILYIVSIFLAAGLLSASVAEAAPLQVKLQTVDGKARIKVGKKLKVNVTCSKKCAGNLRLKLMTPGGNTPVSGKIRLSAGETFKSRFLLTDFGLRYLKKNLSKSKLEAHVSVIDSENGKRTSKTRKFKFYRY